MPSGGVAAPQGSSFLSDLQRTEKTEISMSGARLVFLLFALLEEGMLCYCLAIRNRFGPRTTVGYLAFLGSFPFVAGTPLLQLWLYRRMIGMTAGVPLRDNIIWIVIVEELIALGIILYYANKNNHLQGDSQE